RRRSCPESRTGSRGVSKGSGSRRRRIVLDTEVPLSCPGRGRYRGARPFVCPISVSVRIGHHAIPQERSHPAEAPLGSSERDWSSLVQNADGGHFLSWYSACPTCIDSGVTLTRKYKSASVFRNENYVNKPNLVPGK